MNESIVEARKIHAIPKSKRSNRYKGGMIEKPTAGGVVADVLIYFFMVFVIFVSVVPMWHVLMSSFSFGQKLMAHSGLVFWPVGGWNMGGYNLVFQDSNIASGYGNTLIYVVGATAVGLVLEVVSGYVLSRKVRLKGLLSFFILFTMMFSGGLVPTYMVIRKLGMVGTRWALIIPGSTNAAFIFIIMNAFLQVPESTVEAAEIDGAGHFTLMFKIMLPQAMALTTVIILNSVLMQWNSWYAASIYVATKRDLWPLQLWIKQIVADNVEFLNTSNPDYNRYLVQYGVITIATYPILIAFPFFLKYIEKGVLLGGVKE